MVYEPTEWKNREVEKPRTFNIQNNEDGTVTLLPAEGIITEPGTPVTAVLMNKIEQGLVEVSEGLENYIDGRIEDVTYYIRNEGDDNNTGLTIATAFKTFHKAITTLKKINFGKRIINVGPNVSMSNGTIDYRKHEFIGFIGGSIVFDFNNGNEFAPQFKDCQCRILVKNFTRYDSGVLSTNGYGEPAQFANCLLAEIENMRVNRTGKQSGYSVIEFYNSSGRVADSVFTDVGTGNCVTASGQSFVFVWMPKGKMATIDSIPFNASGGSVIDVVGNQLTGYSIRDEISTGGQIFG